MKQRPISERKTNNCRMPVLIAELLRPQYRPTARLKPTTEILAREFCNSAIQGLFCFPGRYLARIIMPLSVFKPQVGACPLFAQSFREHLVRLQCSKGI